MKRSLNFLIPLASVFLAGSAIADENTNSSPFSFGGVYVANYFANTDGGVSKAESYIDLLSLGVTYEGGGSPKGFLRGRIYGVYSNGTSIGDSVGDLQGVNNTETGYGGFYLQEAWLEYNFGSSEGDEIHSFVRAGVVDLNSLFDTPGTAALFINASHGINPAFSQTGGNGPSIFPVTGLAAIGQVVLDQNTSLRLGVFDAYPGDPTTPNKLNFDLNEGALVVAEAERTTDNLRVYAGAFGYSRRSAALIGTGDARNRGFYGGLELNPNGKTTAFVHYANASPRLNQIANYHSFGVVRKDLFGRKGHDLGVAIANAALSNDARTLLGTTDTSETNYELTYYWPIRDNLALQSDFQYVQNPGADPNLKDAQVIGFRLIYGFGEQ